MSRMDHDISFLDYDIKYVDSFSKLWVSALAADLGSLIPGVRKKAALTLSQAFESTLTNRFMTVRDEMMECFWRLGGVRILLSILPSRCRRITVYGLKILSTIISHCVGTNLGFYDYYDDNLRFSESGGIEVVIGLVLSSFFEVRVLAVDILNSLSSPERNPESCYYYGAKIFCAHGLLSLSCLLPFNYNNRAGHIKDDVTGAVNVILNLSCPEGMEFRGLRTLGSIFKGCLQSLSRLVVKIKLTSAMKKGVMYLFSFHADVAKGVVDAEFRDMLISFLSDSSLEIQQEAKRALAKLGYSGGAIKVKVIKKKPAAKSSKLRASATIKSKDASSTTAHAPRRPSMNPAWRAAQDTIPLAQVAAADPAIFGPIQNSDESDFRDTGRHRLGGSSFCSGVFEVASDGSLWVGKSNKIASEEKARVDAVLEVIAGSINAYCGVHVPCTAVARLPIILPEWANSIADLNLPSNPTHTVYLMSKIMAGFQTFSGMPDFVGGKCVLNFPDRGECEVIGVGRALATASLTLDPDGAGGSYSNAGVIPLGGKMICARVDFGQAFNTDPVLAVGPRQVRVATQAENAVLDFDVFPASVKQEFLETLAFIVDMSDDTIRRFFTRPGAEILQTHEGGCLLTELPALLMRRRDELKAAFEVELQPVAANRPNYELPMAVVAERDIIATLQSVRYQPRTTAPHARLQNGELAADKISCDETKPKLGEGAFAVVRAGKWGSRPVAIKFLKDVSPISIDSLQRECSLLKDLQHPNIVRAYGYFKRETETGEITTCGLVMDYYPDGTLYDWLRSEPAMPWPTRLRVSIDIGEGLEYMHDCGVVHRDLKSINILVKGEQVAIADLGVAKVRTATMMTKTQSVIGTPAWMAPELSDPKEKYTTAVDIYSLGVLLYEVVSGQVPWPDESTARVLMFVMGGVRPEVPEGTDPSYASLMQKCWAQRAKDRPAASEVVEALRAI